MSSEQNPLSEIPWFQDKYSNLIDQKEFTEDVQSLCKEFGLATTLRMLKLFGGQALYFKSLEAVVRPVRDKIIRQRFNGGSDYRDLAREFKLTVSHVRKIVDEG
jgi:Mor family transcriptional regulator